MEEFEEEERAAGIRHFFNEATEVGEEGEHELRARGRGESDSNCEFPPAVARDGVDYAVDVGVWHHGRGVHDRFEVEQGFEEGFCFVFGAVVEDGGHERGLAYWWRGDGEDEHATCFTLSCFS